MQISCLWSKFDIQNARVTLKMRSRSPNLINSFPPPYGIYVQDWSKSTYLFRRQSADKALFFVFIVCGDLENEVMVIRILSNIKSEMRSFKSNENINKKEGGSYYVVSANKASSVTL